MRLAPILLVSFTTLAACGEDDHPVPTNVPATLDAFDDPLLAGEPRIVAASWQQIDYANPQECDLLVVRVTCYPGIAFPFVMRDATCEGCTFTEPPDEGALFDGYAELHVLATAPGPITVSVTVDHAYSDETRALTFSTVVLPRP